MNSLTAMLENELRVFGPPGCGKTTYTSRQIGNAVEKYGEDSVLVASFTKTAAAELVGRGLPLAKDQIGTLHAHCFRLLERPKLAETLIDEWNKDVPEFALSGANASMDEAAVDQTYSTDADKIFMRYQVFRSKMIPRELWTSEVRAFAQKWHDWKSASNVMDFTDMIEICAKEYPFAPGRPSVGFFDEVQDFTPLELTLIRRWSENMDRVVLAGDDDQAIYAFKGSNPEAFLNPPVPESQKRILSQSYRVPRAVQHLASRWIKQIKVREPKEYKPRDSEGDVRVLANGTYKNPEGLLRDAERYLADGKTVMFLGTCSYMLDPIKAVLRREGIPYHNPFRTSRGDWNPLTPGRGTSSSARLLAFLRMDSTVWGDDARVWTPQDLRRWSEIIKAQGNMKRGTRELIDELSDDTDEDDLINLLAENFTEDAFTKALGMDLNWFEGNLLSAKRGPMEFPLKVFRERGAEGLLAKPRIMLGTIHSVKGGEADVVYLFPDLSVAGVREWMASGESRDNIIRQFYVGMTRPKESLVLCQPGSPYYANLAGWVKK